MAIVRLAKHNGKFTKISNKILNDPSVSLRAKGLWAFLMSKPDNWIITIAGSASQLKEGYDALKPVFRELERAGYLRREVVSRGKGDIKKVSTLYEEPRLSSVPNDPHDSSFSSGRNGTLENGLSSGSFTSDVFSSDVKGGHIVTTDKPSTDVAKPEQQDDPTSLSRRAGANAASSAHTAERHRRSDDILPTPLQAESRGLTRFDDPTRDKELNDNDVAYLGRSFNGMFEQRLTPKHRPLLEMIVASDGKKALAEQIRDDWEIHKERIDLATAKELPYGDNDNLFASGWGSYLNYYISLMDDGFPF